MEVVGRGDGGAAEKGVGDEVAVEGAGSAPGEVRGEGEEEVVVGDVGVDGVGGGDFGDEVPEEGAAGAGRRAEGRGAELGDGDIKVAGGEDEVVAD